MAGKNTTTADQESPPLDAVVVGAGFAGLYMVHRLRALGRSVQAFEAGNDVGGTWYWNRYPGARCDVESLQYSYSFSEDLEKDWTWTERYASQPEILRYLQHVAERFDLRRSFEFGTRVTAAHFDEGNNVWRIETDKGAPVRARTCIMASGGISAAQVPDFKGLDQFKGEWYHTGNWPHRPISFKGARVAVIGTGSSGIQAIPVIAAEAEHLTVFQRTPNFSIPAWNAPLPADRAADWKKHFPAYRQTARESRSGILYEYGQRAALDVSADERRQEFEARWARGGPNFTHAFNDIFTNRSANDTAAEFVRAKIRDRVRDHTTAELLSPRDHAIGTKRICVDTDYFETFNRGNVTLIDSRATPIEEITATGVRTASGHYDADRLVFATGYDAMTGALARIDIRGRKAQRLSDVWAAGPRTYLGLMVAGFPNLFTITGPGSPSVLTNVVMSIEQHVDWIARCLADMAARKAKTIEASLEAQDAWVATVNEVAAGTLFPTTKSWYMGANIPGKPQIFLPYIGGLGKYTQICNEVAANDYQGFIVA